MNSLIDIFGYFLYRYSLKKSIVLYLLKKKNINLLIYLCILQNCGVTHFFRLKV